MLQRSNFLICFRFYHIPTDHFLKMKSMYAWKYTSRLRLKSFSNMNYGKNATQTMILLYKPVIHFKEKQYFICKEFIDCHHSIYTCAVKRVIQTTYQ